MFGWWKSYVSSNKNLRCEIMISQDHFIDWGKTQDDHPWTFEKEIVAMASNIDVVVFAFFLTVLFVEKWDTRLMFQTKS